jgi:hypothetical protein
MSDIETASWDEVAANNTAAVPNGFPDRIAPSSVKSIDREERGAHNGHGIASTPP